MIGIYVHHDGAGHRTRAGVLAEVLTARGHDVHLLGSTLTPGPGRIRLALDTDASGVVDHSSADPSAGGRLHWVPLRHNGLRSRMAALAAWVERERPAAVVVDVSVEVTAFVRLMGVPVVVMAQPGRRDDPAHDLGYDIATAIVAPWPPGLDAAPHLDRHRDTVTHVGGLSRYAVAPHPATTHPSAHVGGHLSGLVLSGAEGFDDPLLPDRVRAATPDIAWTVVGGSAWVDDLADLLTGARVVVTHAGQNAVADVAAHAVPAVVVPQSRPWREQVTLASAIDQAGIAVVASPDCADWSRPVAAALLGPARWDRWQTAGAWGRAADVVERVAGERSAPS